MFVEEEVFFETSNFEYIVYQIIGNFHDPQSVSDLPMNLKAEDSENEDREKAEEKSQNYLASNPERDFFQGVANGLQPSSMKEGAQGCEQPLGPRQLGVVGGVRIVHSNIIGEAPQAEFCMLRLESPHWMGRGREPRLHGGDTPSTGDKTNRVEEVAQ